MAGERKPKPSIELDKTFGPALKRSREAAGYSQEELAFRAGLHRTEISLLECAGRLPRFDTLMKLIGALGVDANDLFEGATWVPFDAGTKGHFTYTEAEPE